MSLTARPLWRIRLTRELPRYLLCALVGFGLLASARFAFDPPRPVVQHVAPPIVAPRDLAAEGYASLFTRRYLTWEAQDPEAHRRALRAFVGSRMDGDAGLQPPSSGEELVQWTEIVQQREPRAGEHIYTVAAQTDVAGLLYLTVSVIRSASGALALGGYPAFVGAPASSPNAAGIDAAIDVTHAPDVEDRMLATVVKRALRNYLALAPSELAADLSGSARVSLPGLKLTTRAFERLWWLPGGGSVEATVLVGDGQGAQYTLDYELDVTRQGGRWEISAIQMDPYS